MSSPLRLVATCWALSYPLWWGAQFVVNALPALVQVAVTPERLDYLRVHYWEASAASFDPGVPPDTGPRRRMTPDSVIAAAASAAVALIAGRRHRATAGLAAVMIGVAVLTPSLFPLFARRFSFPVLVHAGVGVAVIACGLGWMTQAVADRRYVARAGLLAAAVVLPLAVWWWSWINRFWIWIAVPITCAAVVPLLRVAPRAWPETWKPAIAGLACTLLVAASLTLGIRRGQTIPEVAASTGFVKALPFQRGVNFTAEGFGGYESGRMPLVLEALPQYGVNAVALVPYGFLSATTPRVRLSTRRGSLESDAGIAEASRLAHRLGMTVLLKPHVWRNSTVELATHERAQWFADYTAFMEHYARLAVRIHADLLAVGVEFVKIAQYEQEWRAVIARVRQIYPGPLVYAANFGPEFETLKFWDALDYVGLDNYYPLPDDLSTDDVVRKVEVVVRRAAKPLIFTEAGFSTFESPHREPWADRLNRPLAPEDQARCYEAVFRAFYHQPWFRGMYWWKVGTNGYGGVGDPSHTPWRKPAMEVVKHWYLKVRESP